MLVARPRRELALARYALQKLYRQVEVGGISCAGGAPTPDVALVPRPHGGPPLLQVCSGGVAADAALPSLLQQGLDAGSAATQAAADACHAARRCRRRRPPAQVTVQSWQRLVFARGNHISEQVRCRAGSS